MAISVTGSAPLVVTRNSAVTTAVTSGAFTPAAGDKLVLAFVWTKSRYGNTLSSLTDTQSGTWTLRASANPTAVNAWLYIYERTAGTTGSSTTATATWGGNVYVPSIAIVELSGSVGALSFVSAHDENVGWGSPSSSRNIDFSGRTGSNAVIGGIIGQWTNAMNAPGGGFSEIEDSVGSDTDGLCIHFHATGGDTDTYTISTGNMDFGSSTGVEVSEAAGGGPTGVVVTNYFDIQ